MEWEIAILSLEDPTKLKVDPLVIIATYLVRQSSHCDRGSSLSSLEGRYYDVVVCPHRFS